MVLPRVVACTWPAARDEFENLGGRLRIERRKRRIYLPCCVAEFTVALPWVVACTWPAARDEFENLGTQTKLKMGTTAQAPQRRTDAVSHLPGRPDENHSMGSTAEPQRRVASTGTPK